MIWLPSKAPEIIGDQKGQGGHLALFILFVMRSDWSQSEMINSPLHAAVTSEISPAEFSAPGVVSA